MSRYSDNENDHFTVRLVDKDHNNTNTDNIVQTYTTQYTDTPKPLGQFYSVNHGEERGSTFHMNVVNENCVYEPTGYSKKVLDLRTQPVNSDSLCSSNSYNFNHLRPDSLNINTTYSDVSSNSGSTYSVKDDERGYIQDDSYYTRNEKPSTSASFSPLSDSDKTQPDKYSTNPTFNGFLDSSRRNEKPKFIETKYSDPYRNSPTSLRSFSPKSAISRDESVVSEKTVPYINLTSKVKECPGTPSSFSTCDYQTAVQSPANRHSSFTKSHPNSPMIYNMPPRALSAKDSITSDRSSRLDPHTYQSYAAGILYSTGKSEQFLKLQKHFAVLERISDIEEKSKDGKSRNRIQKGSRDNVDYHEENVKDEELDELYAELNEAQKKKEFFYNVSYSHSHHWIPDQDLGLLKKEKSLGDLRSEYLNQNKDIKPKAAFTLEVEDEFRRETEFLNLYEKYKYCDYLNEDFNTSMPNLNNSYNSNQIVERDFSDHFHSRLSPEHNEISAHVDSIRDISKSEPNINVKYSVSSSKKNHVKELKQSEPHKMSSSDLNREDTIIPVVTTDAMAVPVEENEIKPVTYTGVRIDWKKLEKNSLFSSSPDLNISNSKEDFIDGVHMVNNSKAPLQSDILTTTKCEKQMAKPSFVVKNLRGLAENNEFSQSRFGRLKRSVSHQEKLSNDKSVPALVPARKHKDPVPLPVSRKKEEIPPSFTDKSSSQMSDLDYSFNYKDMGNAGSSRDKVTEIKKMAFSEKLEMMQKINDEKIRDFDKSFAYSSMPSDHSKNASFTHKHQEESYLNKSNSLPNQKRRVSGNSIFHKQNQKATSEDDVSEHPPAFSSVMISRSNHITPPELSYHEPFISKFQSPSQPQSTNPSQNLRSWQPQNLADANSSISSNFVNSSTETFIVNSDEDLSTSQTSSLISKRRDNYQTNSNFEKSRSEPDLNITYYGPNRPRSAKSQVNINDEESKKPHWRRVIGVEYVNEPFEGRLPRTLSGDLADVRRKWEDGKWNAFGRSQSSESQTSLDNYYNNDSLHSDRRLMPHPEVMESNLHLQSLIIPNSSEHQSDNIKSTEPSQSNGRLYGDAKRSLMIKTPSSYNYDPYLPPSDIVNEVEKFTEGTKLIHPKPKNRTPSLVGRMTLEYFDQIGGEWKYGNRPHSNSTSNLSIHTPSSDKLNDLSNTNSENGTNDFITRNETVPVPGQASINSNKTSAMINGYESLKYNSLPNPKRNIKKEKPIPSKRSVKSNGNATYQYYANITDQDKLMQNNVPKPILRNTNKTMNGNNTNLTNGLVNNFPLQMKSSSGTSTYQPPSVTDIPPPPNRKAPPVPRSITPTSRSSSRSDHHHHHHHHHSNHHSSSTSSSRADNSNLTTSNQEWTPTHVKQDDQSKSRFPNAQNTNISNVDSHSDPNLIRHDPVSTSHSLPISPHTDITSPPSGTQQSPTIIPAKLRMPRSNLSAAEQLGVKSPPLVNTNENGAFKHQTSDVKRLVPMSEKEKRRKDEERLYRKQRLEQLYEEERRRKALQEEHDIESRRHNDFFVQSMKSPISNDRFNDTGTNGVLGVQTIQPQALSPSSTSSHSPMATLSVPNDRRRGFQIQGKAKALYSFNAQNPRELPFRKGDIIYLLRQIDKNWFEGERYGRKGIFPVNYVEVMTSIEAAQAAAVQAEGQGRVKYNFTAQSPVELSLRKGEYVTLLRSVDENWYEGRSGNKQGIFPSAYVEIMREPSTPLITPAPSVICTPMTGRGTPEMLSPVGYDAPTPPPQPSPSAFNKPSHFPPTQFNYRQQPQQQQSPGALRSQSNPLSPLINHEVEHRVFGQKTQLSPTQGKKQVTINTALNQDERPSTSTASKGYGVKSKVADDDLAINRYRAIYAYKPQNEDELELQEGDEVYVMEKCDDGWYVGTSGRSGNFGTFPGNYVQLICKFNFL